MDLKKLFPWLLIAALILAGTTGCKADELTAIKLVPQGANLIASIELSQVINDQAFRDAYNKAEKEPGQPQTFEEALDEVAKKTGIDLRDSSRGVVFADIATLEQAGYIAVIVEGNFNEPQFIGSIEQNTGEKFTTTNYRGYKLYTDEEKEFVIAFLSDSMLLLGTTKAVKDSIDVSTDDRKQVSGEISDAYNQLDDALIKFALKTPEKAREVFTEESTLGEMPISLEPFVDIGILGFALSKKAETITIQIDSYFLSADSAQDTKDIINGAISLFKGTLEVTELKELLGKIEVSLIDSQMTIALEVTLPELERLAGIFRPQREAKTQP